MTSIGLNTLVLNTTIDVSIDSIDDLPELPAGVPAPGVSFDFGDEDGKLYVYFDFEPAEESICLHFWMNEEGETFNSVYQGGEETPWDGDDLEAVLEYGSAITSRIASKIDSINRAIVRSTVAKQIIDSSLGRRSGGRETTDQARFVEPGDSLIGTDGTWTAVTDVRDDIHSPSGVYFETEFGRIYRESNEEVRIARW